MHNPMALCATKLIKSEKLPVNRYWFMEIDEQIPCNYEADIEKYIAIFQGFR